MQRLEHITWQVTWCHLCCDKFLSLQQATQIQTDLVLFDLSQQENSITGTKIFRKYFPVHTKWYVVVQKE